MNPSQQREIRWSVVAIAAALIVFCMAFALGRIRVESDLTTSIPAGNPVLESGRRLLAKHPLIDWVAIDLGLSDGSQDSERLVEAAKLVQESLRGSKEFASVGNAGWVEGIAELHGSLVRRLPTLFSREELEHLVLPRLSDSAIRARLAESYATLGELDGVGQAQDIAGDPLGLRELVYARLASLFPKTNARIEQNQLVSSDNRHLLLTAVPHHALGDPESSRRIAHAVDVAQQRLDEASAANHKTPVKLTPTGAYRAAMDNEAIVKQDTNRAVWLVTIAVSLLLLACFSRPVLGLLTLLPATAGVAISLLLYSFYKPTMSALSLGFGAALISITVDQGIVYIAYLDRVRGATGRKASEQTFSAVSLATLTTVGAFFALKFSGYQLLEELGIFAALGSAFSFAFVHSVFPLVFRATLPTERRPLLPVDDWLRWLATGRVWPRVLIGSAIAVGLGAFARPKFEVDLNRLNTVSAATRLAEEQVRGTWGDLMSRAYVLVEADDPAQVQRRADQLALLLQQERALGQVADAFSPSQLWPGEQLAKRNFDAWRRFWSPSRRTDTRKLLVTAGSELGFTTDAFDAFLSDIDAPKLSWAPIPKAAYDLLGLAEARDGRGWVWLGAVERGDRYEPNRFATQAQAAGFSVFDGGHFARKLNDFLGIAFKRMLLIVAPFVLVAVGLTFQNPRLILLVLFPVLLALVATLGTFGLIGRPIDIPGLMIAVVVLGMGTNFSVYLVHAHQRYPNPLHPVHDSVRIAALLDGGATVLGMGVMAASAHVAARSAGLSGLLGIGFSLFGALALLPPILQRCAPIGEAWDQSSKSVRKRYLSRFRFLEPSPKWAARRAMGSARLTALNEAVGDASHVLLVGGGYGIEAAWILAHRPNCQVTLIESDEDRRQVARSVLGDRGTVIELESAGSLRLEAPCDALVVLDRGVATENMRTELSRLNGNLRMRIRVVVEAHQERLGELENLLPDAALISGSSSQIGPFSVFGNGD